MKNALFALTAVLCLSASAFAQSSPHTVVTCQNQQGRTAIISQDDATNTFSAIVYTRAGVGPAVSYQNLTLSQPHELGAPTIFASANFSLMVLSNQTAAWGSLDVPGLNIRSEKVSCN